MAVYRRVRRSFRRRRGRRQRFSRASMWKTALATHEGTSISRDTDVTAFPLVDNIAGTQGYAFKSGTNGLSEHFGDPDQFPNHALPEMYAFRDGLHLRVTTPLSLTVPSPEHDVFVPLPGPVLGVPKPYYMHNPMDQRYARSYAGKVMAVSPGTLWNVWNRYAGIQRGEGRGQRSGRSILSLGFKLTTRLTPAVLDIPVVQCSDATAALVSSTGVYNAGGNHFVAPGARTSYVMPTWATVILFSYKQSGKDYLDKDDARIDSPAHNSNTLAWIRNRNTTTTTDAQGIRTVQPAEAYIGRLGTPTAGTYRPGIDENNGNPGPVADYNIPLPRSEPIRHPSDIWIDENKVTVHKMKTVYFRNKPTALRDAETTLEHRWRTGQQFDWEFDSVNTAFAATGSTVLAGAVGTSDPPTSDVNGFTRIDATSTNPGILSLQHTPRVGSKVVSFNMRFNGKRIDFDDDQDDDEPAFTVVRRADRYATGPSDPSVTVTDENQAGAALRVMEEEDDGDGEAITVPDQIPQESTGPAEAVVRARDYADNIPYNNMYMTVVTPCYKIPVGVSSPVAGPVPTFQVPNWGAIPVKVTAYTSYTFKR